MPATTREMVRTTILIGAIDLADEGMMDSPHASRNGEGSIPGTPRQKSVRFPTHFQHSDRQRWPSTRDVPEPEAHRIP